LFLAQCAFVALSTPNIESCPAVKEAIWSFTVSFSETHAHPFNLGNWLKLSPRWRQSSQNGEPWLCNSSRPQSSRVENHQGIARFVIRAQIGIMVAIPKSPPLRCRYALYCRAAGYNVYPCTIAFRRCGGCFRTHICPTLTPLSGSTRRCRIGSATAAYVETYAAAIRDST
jgi:hypothetical protein